MIFMGQTVSHDHDIGTGWTHVTAIRQGRELQLYVDGEQVATSQAPDSHTFDLTNPRPLTIGAGLQGTFAGCIADLRLYNGVLNDNQVKAIASL